MSFEGRPKEEKIPSPEDFYRAKSEFHGEGVFLRIPVKEGAIIGIISGLNIKKVNASKEEATKPEDANHIGIDKDEWIDPDFPFSHINHSCNPNVGIRGTTDVVALKDIAANTELTLDYSMTEMDPYWEMHCNCNEEDCRRVIGNIISVPEEHFMKSFPHINENFKAAYLRYNKKDAQ